MQKKTLLFAPVAYNLAETTRALEIAKGIRRHVQAVCDESAARIATLKSTVCVAGQYLIVCHIEMSPIC
jgi:hypothetical protein